MQAAEALVSQFSEPLLHANAIRNKISFAGPYGLRAFDFLRAIFFLLLITFANSLDPDQDQQNICPDLDPKRLTFRLFLKDFFENINSEKSQHRT